MHQIQLVSPSSLCSTTFSAPYCYFRFLLFSYCDLLERQNPQDKSTFLLVNKMLARLSGTDSMICLYLKVCISFSMCDVVCYRERGREVNFPTLQCLNQQARRLAVKMIYEWRLAPRTLWPAICWTKKGIQVTRVSWPDGIVGEGKCQMIGLQTLRAKMLFFVRENWKRIFSLWTEVSRETCWLCHLRDVPRP